MGRTVDVSGVNKIVRNIRAGRPPMEAKKREQIREVKQELESEVESRTTAWEALGLSTREAEVASYREFGFTDEAIAQLTSVSEETVDEYSRLANRKYDRAAQLVTRAESTGALDESWTCRHCGYDSHRSDIDIEYDVGADTVEYQCQNCGEKQRS